MKPIHLTIQAFGSYGKKTVIDFNKLNQNLFLITGDTGAGKSTIFDAISFALFGETGSNTNKRDGSELQSHFVDFDLDPFVELLFSEKVGGEILEYTVKRVPRHSRYLKRKNAKAEAALKEVKETVSLILPDGSEYSHNNKETDRKLEEIVGLTKQQFMQVAMIAQGEFMELLREDSNKKKEIFRKLFNTGIFEEIVNELGIRIKEKTTDIGKIRTICQNEVSHAFIPEDYEFASALTELRDAICNSERLSVSDMEAFLSELDRLCMTLKERREAEAGALYAAQKERDAARDALTKAQALSQSFQEFKRSEQELIECASLAPLMEENEKKAARINSAYSVAAEHKGFQDAKQITQDIETKLNGLREKLPGMLVILKEKEKDEESLREALDLEMERFTKVSEKVKKAMRLFDEIEKAGQGVKEAKKALVIASRESESAGKAFADFEAQEKKWRQRQGELSESGRKLAIWEAEIAKIDSLLEETNNIKQLRRDLLSQEKKAEKARAAYAKAREAFNEKNQEYLTAQNAYLDAQAGFLAVEKLRENEPCPVCGSLDHPRPCKVPEKDSHLTRDFIEALSKEASDLQKTQEKAASAANSAAEILNEKEGVLKEALSRLLENLGKSVCNSLESRTLNEDADEASAEKILLERKESLVIEGKRLKACAAELMDIEKALKTVDSDREKLSLKRDRAFQALSERKETAAKLESAYEALIVQKDYEDTEAAASARSEAEKARNDMKKTYDIAHRSYELAKAEQEKAEGLKARYETELPGLKAKAEERRFEYEKSLQETDFNEAQWRELIEKYTKQDAKELLDKVSHYRVRKASAEGARAAALQAIEGQEEPDMLELSKATELCEVAYAQAQERFKAIDEAFRENNRVHSSLAPKMKERASAIESFTKLDSIHKRLNGKISGSRMDIETFAQRYYLERILFAANARFREMSSGQFELRMVGEDQAGEGKNRGLDLMVYSTVTGREREVRTLSGGESFMAALSLALGMADQISAKVSGINLDIMFIDEGFGSLDDKARSQAVKVLQQMAAAGNEGGESKLIGIISHVTELKQEIEDQLLVMRDEEGSHVRWKIS